ncbi:MAG: septation protein IspZ [Steroidobacteraceae bacterium]|nr:septation protein IspZ [Steroidobacteraceae bacterium]MDW8258408.1 septation protein IspZ [Gammaproteobacteria bacterium]
MTVLLPLVAFVAAYWLRGIYVATAVLMAAMVLLVLWEWRRTRRVAALHACSAVLVLLFGALTLWLRDPQFIKLKPTMLFGALALVHLGSEWLGQRVLAQHLLGSLHREFTAINPRDWRRANRACALFYGLLALGNFGVARFASERTWVGFKAVGLLALTLVFFVALVWWLMQRPELQRAVPR